MANNKKEETIPDEQLLEKFKEAQEEYNETIFASNESNDRIIEELDEENTTENNGLNGNNIKNRKNQTKNKKKKL